MKSKTTELLAPAGSWEALEAADMHGYREFLEEAPTLRAFRFKSISDATNLRSGRNRPDGAGAR